VAAPAPEAPLPTPREAATRSFLQAVERERQGDRDAALALYRQALALHGAFPQAAANLAALLAAAGKGVAAIAVLRRALAAAPAAALLYCRLGELLRVAFRLDEAAELLARARALEPGDWEAWFHSGLLRLERGEDGEAVLCFDRALALAPAESPMRIAIHWHRAMAFLARGDFATGFAEAEVRYALKPPPARPFPMPLWRGEALAGRRLLVWSDQGFGDTIQFARFLPLLEAEGAGLVFAVQPELAPLMDGLSRHMTLIAPDDPLPQADFHVPLMSLPYRLGTTLATLPAAVPYLRPPPGRPALHLERAPETRLAVGIVWAGHASHPQDYKRSAPFEPFLALCDIPGVALVSLQSGPRGKDLAAAGAEALVYDLGRHLGGFAESAAALLELDLLVSVDTAMVHLAGALARPAWVTLPYAADWRWLRGREDSPWYPSLRLFRQDAPGDWDGLLARVRAAILERLA